MTTEFNIFPNNSFNNSQILELMETKSEKDLLIQQLVKKNSEGTEIPCIKLCIRLCLRVCLS